MPNLYQEGITADTARWGDYIASLRLWLSGAVGPTSIPYRIVGLDPAGIYPRVLTAAPVITPDNRTGFVYGHCITIDDSLLIGSAQFEHEECPKLHFLPLEVSANG